MKSQEESSKGAKKYTCKRFVPWLFLAGLICIAAFQVSAQTNAIQTSTEQNGANSIRKTGTFTPPPGDKVIGSATPQTFAKIKEFEKIKAKAEKGNPEAQFELGLLYQNGNGVATNLNEAVKWWHRAADQGLSKAEFRLGLFYNDGTPAARDPAKAVKWYQEAANHGLSGAEWMLGVSYAEGWGVTQDVMEAVKWYRKAAKQGDWVAESMLGECYAKGDGVPQNDIEAYVWLSLAAAQGDRGSARLRDIIAKRMSREEIVAGQQRAAAFVPHREIPSVASNKSASFANLTATGTGFFITEDGYLISNYHVVKDATKVRLLTGAGMVDAKVVQVDAVNDLALLKAAGHFALLPIAPSRNVQLGKTVATVGFPDPGLQGFSPKLAKGEIASLSGAADDARYFQVSVPVQPGNSGGALVDNKGNVVGIVSAKLDASAALAASGALPENVNYAIKSSYLLSFLESVSSVEAKLKKPNSADEKFEDVVKQAQVATVLVLVY